LNLLSAVILMVDLGRYRIWDLYVLVKWWSFDRLFQLPILSKVSSMPMTVQRIVQFYSTTVVANQEIQKGQTYIDERNICQYLRIPIAGEFQIRRTLLAAN